MSIRTKVLAWGGICALPMLAMTRPVAAVVTVTDQSSASALANAIVGSGLTIVGTPTLTSADASQQGMFSSTDSTAIGFTNGVVFSTGSAHTIEGPNTSDNTTSAWNTAGDAALSVLAGNTTQDANTLQFNFTVPSGTTSASFRYVFGSEEYNEYVGSINDAFALFVDGTNVALLPNNAPVTIGNVNSSVNSAYYRNNDLSDLATPPIDTGLDGLTTVLTANVLPALNSSLTIHTIRIAIADANDASYDSAVMIEAGSFTSLPEPATLSLLAMTMLGWNRRRR